MLSNSGKCLLTEISLCNNVATKSSYLWYPDDDWLHLNVTERFEMNAKWFVSAQNLVSMKILSVYGVRVYIVMWHDTYDK